jgi:AmpE protein
MLFIVILLGLLLERTFNVSQHLYKLSLFDQYQRKLHTLSGENGVIGLVLVVLPAVLLVWGVTLVFSPLFYHLAGFIIALIVFVLCLGAGNLRQQVDDCIRLVEQDKEEEAQAFVKEHFTCFPSAQGTAKQLVSVVFKESHERIFGLLFWFVLLGPVGAVLYRMMQKLSVYYHLQHEDKSIYQLAAWCTCVLDWIPVRLMALSFSLIGHFTAVFPVWLKSIGVKLSREYEFLVACGNAALSLTNDPAAIVAQSQLDAAFSLVNRALLIWLVVIALLIVF